MTSRNERVRARIEDLLDRSREALREQLIGLATELDDTSTLERAAGLVAASSVAEGVRALDAATTLSGILDELTRAAAAHAPRVALLLRSGQRLRGWSWLGFEGQAPAFEAPLDEAGLVGEAVRTGERAVTAPGRGDGQAGHEARPSRLQPSRDDRAGLAVPLRIGGIVIGALYADNDGEAPATVPSAWPELIEVLVRHAERCLEAATARRLPELLRAGAAERARRFSQGHDEEAAQRYARLLVAEIKLYYEPLVDEGRRERALLRLLRPQIERAHQLYEERVSAAVRARTNYFEQELVRTLAGGDTSLLGHTS